MNDSHISGLDLRNTQQLGFLASLPCDIIPVIFLHLDQRDCLTSMAVCRHWYYTIPQYAQDVWKTLRLNARDVHTKNQCLIHCLGDHVKRVILDNFTNEDVYRMIHKLIDWECTKINSLEFNNCSTTNQDALLDALAMLSPHLTHLKMLSHGSNIAFLHVLNACPRLTHFTYRYKEILLDDTVVIDEEPTVLNSAPSIGLFPNIVHLILDAMLDTKMLLNPILMRCPNLRFFAGTSFATADIQNNEHFPRYVVNFDLLFYWCPKLTHIDGPLSYVYLKEFSDYNDSNDENGITGLREFNVAEAYQQNGIVRRLTESQDSLESLSVNPILAYETPFSWPAILTSLEFKNLQTLTFRRIRFDATTIIRILNRCPALQMVSLETSNLVIGPAAVQLLRPMLRLRRLIWSFISFDDGLSMVSLLERLPCLESLILRYLTVSPTFPEGYKCPEQLKNVCLRDIQWTEDSDDNDRNKAPTRLIQWFATHSKVEEVILSGISNFSTKELPAIATISTLKSLEVDLEETQCGEAEAADLYQFATSLNGTAIETVYIETWWHLPNTTVSKLKELLQIKDLHVYHRWEEHYCPQCSCRHEPSSSSH